MLVEPAPRAIPARSFAGLTPLSTRALRHALDRRQFFERATPEEIIRADERELRNRLWCLGGSVGGSWGGRMATYAATFRPDKVSGCLRYGFVESASDAASYPDLTGNGHVFEQGTADARPTFNATALNGRPALVFDGTNDVLVCTTSLASDLIGGEDKPCTIGLVLQVAVDAIGYVYSPTSSSAWQPHFALRTHTSARWRIDKGDDDGVENECFTLNNARDDNPVVLIVRHTGQAISARANGAAVAFASTASNVGTLTLNELSLGGRLSISPGGFLAFTLAADVCYSRHITDDECQYLERGYAARYGITLAT